MKKALMLFFAVINITTLFSQNTFRAIIRDEESKEPLPGATAIVQGTTIGSGADTSGMIELNNIPDGRQVIIFSFIGYETQRIHLHFPVLSEEPVEIFLENAGEELDEIVITSTRTSRTIEDIPTRVETIAGEELEEKGNMKPGDIRMMLNESTGIQTQQTSATSYNSSIRIQGLDGKYTQILRDGFPLYSGFSGGLSLLQIVPLDLKQVEVIKGASSTLYGGGAISGLVNLISKIPEEERELSFLLNGTSALGTDVSGFFSQKFNKAGTTLFASFNSGNPYDPAGIGLSAIPEFTRFTFNPKLYFYLNERATLNIGFNNTSETRTGGDMKYIEGKGDNIHSYFEKNKTNRISTQSGFDMTINGNAGISIKNSLGYYERSIEIPDNIFSGSQFSSFSEATYNLKNERVEWIAGLNLWTDNFTQTKADTGAVVDYNHKTAGVFVQNTFNISEVFSLESGLRADYQNVYGLFILPRLSALWKINHKLTARLGGGFGYKNPTVFTEDAERIHFKNVLPVDVSKVDAERSAGGNIDINFKTPLTEKLFLAANTLFFYTQINDPVVLSPISGVFYEFSQPEGSIVTRGIEMNIKMTYESLKLFIGYTLADVRQHYGGLSETFPLVARPRLNNVLMYEIEDKLKIGVEAYYIGPQMLNDGTSGKQYWLAGFMAEKIWKNFSIFVNFENFTDTRQTKFDSIYNGSITYPEFRDIYAPVEGFVVNGGIKLKL